MPRSPMVTSTADDVRSEAALQAMVFKTAYSMENVPLTSSGTYGIQPHRCGYSEPLWVGSAPPKKARNSAAHELMNIEFGDDLCLMQR